MLASGWLDHRLYFYLSHALKRIVYQKRLFLYLLIPAVLSKSSISCRQSGIE
ncbi:hypothetical protein LguiA_036065 [Lonicera macranthoides]